MIAGTHFAVGSKQRSPPVLVFTGRFYTTYENIVKTLSVPRRLTIIRRVQQKLALGLLVNKA